VANRDQKDHLFADIARWFRAIGRRRPERVQNTDAHSDEFYQLRNQVEALRSTIGDVLAYVSNGEAPRKFTRTFLELNWWDLRRPFQQRVEVNIWCEELDRPVPGAVETVTLDKVWVKSFRKAAPFIRKFLAVAAKVVAKAAGFDIPGKETAKDLEDLLDNTCTVLDAVERMIGEGQNCGTLPEHGGKTIVLKRGQFVEPAVAKVLCAAARKGGMMQIQMGDDKRWRWVSREIADRNGRSVLKEPG
jgi:hypothetical protein